MKKTIIAVLLFCLLSLPAAAVNLATVEKSKISYKGGPSEVHEPLAIVWIEALLYPKQVAAGEEITMAVRLTSKVREVRVSFDFDSANAYKLSSKDNMIWEGTYDISKNVKDGLHVARFEIATTQGQISRTLDFIVAQKPIDESMAKNIEPEEGWPLKVISDSMLFVDSNGNISSGSKIKEIKKDAVIKGLYKVPWYKVRLEDGSEGWLISVNVQEPVEEFYQKGYGAYKAGDYGNAIKNYSKAVKIDPSFSKGWYWLAKSYWKIKDENKAVSCLNKVLTIDPHNLDAILFASVLAQKYFDKAHALFKAQNYKEAIVELKKVVELKPTSITALTELAQCYANLGMPNQSQATWREVLKLDPENEPARVALNMKENKDLSEDKKVSELRASFNLGNEEVKKEEPPQSVNYVDIVKATRTYKGTPIARAIKSVVELTRSLGTLVVEDGWSSNTENDKVLIKYICRQDRTGKGKEYTREEFIWGLDTQGQNVYPQNNNAKLLMSSW